MTYLEGLSLQCHQSRAKGSISSATTESAYFWSGAATITPTVTIRRMRKTVRVSEYVLVMIINVRYGFLRKFNRS